MLLGDEKYYYRVLFSCGTHQIIDFMDFDTLEEAEVFFSTSDVLKNSSWKEIIKYKIICCEG